MPEESAEPPKRPAGRSVSLPSSPFEHGPPSQQLSRALSSHLDRCMSAHSYHASRGRQQRPASSSSPARSSVIAAALETRARRFSFVDGDDDDGSGEAFELLAPVEVDGEAAAAAAAAAFAAATAAVAPTEPAPSPSPEPRGTVLDGAAILFTAIASFPALSLPWAVSTMTMWPGLAALALCGVATAAYSCWLVSYLVGYRPPPKEGKEEQGTAAAAKAASKATAAAAAATTADAEAEGEDGARTRSEDSVDDGEGRYHDMAASILGHRTASLFVTPIQVVVCFGICVATMLLGGTSLKALSRILGSSPRAQSSSTSSSSPPPSSSTSPLTLSQWIAVYAAFQASSAFVPSLASSAAVAIAGCVAFLLFFSLATAYSAVAGVQLKRDSSSPLPADFYSLAAPTSPERAFAALNGLGIALFAWSNAFAPEVQSTLKKPQDGTFRRSTLAAFGLLIPCYVLIGGLGYWAFGKDSNVVVLLNMEPASSGGVVAGGSGSSAEGGKSSSSSSPFEGAPRAALAAAWLSVLVNLYALFAMYSFPVYECLDAFVARRVVEGVRRRRRRRKKMEAKAAAASAAAKEVGGEKEPSPLVSAVAARAAGRLLFCGCCALIAAALPFFGDIAAVLGVLSLALDFILPSLMFMKVRGAKLGRAAASGLMATAGFYVLLGGAIMVAALRSLFLNAHTYKLFADL